MRFDFLPRSKRLLDPQRQRERERSRNTAGHVRAWNGANYSPLLDRLCRHNNERFGNNRPPGPSSVSTLLPGNRQSRGDRQRGTHLVAAFVIFVSVWLRAQVRAYLARCGLDKTFYGPAQPAPSRTDELSTSERESSASLNRFWFSLFGKRSRSPGEQLAWLTFIILRKKFRNVWKAKIKSLQFLIEFQVFEAYNNETKNRFSPDTCLNDRDFIADFIFG